MTKTKYLKRLQTSHKRLTKDKNKMRGLKQKLQKYFGKISKKASLDIVTPSFLRNKVHHSNLKRKLKKNFQQLSILSLLSILFFTAVAALYTTNRPVNESKAAGSTVQFNLTALSGPESITQPGISTVLDTADTEMVTVDYTVGAGTATGSGTDYTLANGTITFPAGITTQEIPLKITNDSVLETSETISLTLSNPSSGTNLGTNTSFTYTIIDDDIALTNPNQNILSSISPTAWFDANDGTGQTVDGSNVSNWTDKSGNNHSVSEANTANQPVFQSNQINGQSVVRFATGDQLTKPSVIPVTGSYSAFAVNQRTNAGTIFYNGTSASNGFGMGTFGSGSRSFLHGGVDFNTAGANTTNLEIWSAIRSGGNNNFYIDGSSVLTNSLGLNNPTGNFSLGVFGSADLIGDIGEVIIFDSGLNSTRQKLIHNYLSSKFNHTISNDLYSLEVGAGSDVKGIGKEIDGTETISSDVSALKIQENSTSLANGEYVLVGHNNQTTNTATTDLPVGVSQRWSRIWGVDKTSTDGVDAKLTFDLSKYSNITPPSSGTDYKLLYRSGTTGSFADAALTPNLIGTQVSFDLSNSNLQDGYYTLGTSNSSVSTLGVILPDPVANLDATTGNNQATLTWSPPSSPSVITDYIVLYSNDGFINDVRMFNDGVSSSTGTTVTNLIDGPSFSFRVQAVNSGGGSLLSNIDSVTLSPTIDSISPNTGSILGGNQVSISGKNLNNSSKT
ncbi:MAG: hypothetical protein HC932_02600 [Thermales bacterium]|nr:hypothetical protein [Thermales bacterium]